MFGTFNWSRAVAVASLTLVVATLSGCGWFGGDDKPAMTTTAETGASASETAKAQAETGCPPNAPVDECGGSYLLGKKASTADDAAAPSAGAKIGVNSYLWRAALDTVSFMPLISVDPFGGVIITDWYSNPNAPNERFKMTVYVLDTELRADAVKVNLFKQVRSNSGWSDQPADAITASKLEDAILTRARELRLAGLGQ